MIQKYISCNDIFEAIRFDGKNIDEVKELKGDSDYRILPDGSLGIDIGTSDEQIVQPDEFVHFDPDTESWETMPEDEFRCYHVSVTLDEEEEKAGHLVRNYCDVSDEFTEITIQMESVAQKCLRYVMAYRR